MLFRIGIVAFAAFIAGAVVQRMVLGQYALKLGVLEFGEIKDAADDALTALQTAVKDLGVTVTKLGETSTALVATTNTLGGRTDKLADQEGALSARVIRNAAASKKAIQALSDQVEGLRKRLPPEPPPRT